MDRVAFRIIELIADNFTYYYPELNQLLVDEMCKCAKAMVDHIANAKKENLNG